MDDKQVRDWRYERKFLVADLTLPEVTAIIKRHPGLFTQLYPPRWVNSIYLDSATMQSYWDNMCGAQDRRKVRVRWYGPMFGEIQKPILEFKIKRGLVGYKELYPVKTFRLDRHFSQAYFIDVVLSSPLPPEIKNQVRDLTAVLLNQYWRSYLATIDKNYRLTVDSEMVFYAVGRLSNSFIHHYQDRRNIVVELKYGIKQDQLVDRIASFFPFPVTKNSKYVRGIELIHFL